MRVHRIHKATDVGLGLCLFVDQDDPDDIHHNIRVDRIVGWRYSPRNRTIMISTVDGDEWQITDAGALDGVAMRIDEHLAQVFSKPQVDAEVGS